MSARGWCWTYLLCLSLSSGFAQESRRITLDVVVTDKSDKPVAGLQEQDFTLLDNKQPARILSFADIQSGSATADPPVEVILLVDEVNTSFTAVSSERQEVEKFLKRNGGELERPVSMVFLSDSGAEIGSLSSRDGSALIAQLNQHESGLRVIRKSQGVYGASDRVQLSLRALEQLVGYEETRPGRKLVIWISPGWPLLSGVHQELDSKSQQSIFKTVVALSDALRRARITLYSIDPLGTNDANGFRTSYYEEFVKGVKKVNQVHIGNLGLQVLATQSGGRVFHYSNDIAGEIATSIADANAFYVLSFDGLPGDGPDEYHALDVKIDKPGLAARTRTGYYAQP